METAAVVAVHCVLARASAGRATGGLMVMESAGADAAVGLWRARASGIAKRQVSAALSPVGKVGRIC
jgi:hypothetical protein